MKNKATLGIIIVLVAVSFTTLFGTNAEEPKKVEVNPAEQSEEGQKTYVVYLNWASMADENLVLRPIDGVNFNGVECLTGTQVRQGTWMLGKRVYIPVNSVKFIVEFDSLVDYEKAARKYTEQQKKKVEDYYQPGR